MKKKQKLLIFFLLCFFTLNLFPAPAIIAAPAEEKPTKDETKNTLDYAKDRVIIKFKAYANEKDKDLVKKEFNVQTIKKFTLAGSELLKIKADQKVSDVIEKLKKHPGVLYAEPDYLHKADAIPNDTYFNSLWGLNSTSNIDIDAPEAWNITQGSSDITVAVIDEGVDINHPDIAANIWTNPGEIANDGIDNDGNGFVDDVNGWDFFHYDSSVYDPVDGDDHGTHVAGTIAAIANNSAGIAGVAPGVRIMPLKFLGPGGGYTSDAVSALEYAKRMGARVASNSWGGGGYSTTLRDTINSFNGVFVAAAGNDSLNTDLYPHYPSSFDCPNIISVAAVDSQGALAYFSNYGTTTVDVGAPGVSIYSLKPGSSYQFMSGTSMATPHVSGIAALLLAMNPSLAPSGIADLIKQKTKLLASLQGKTASGGMANAYQTLIAIKGQGPFVTRTAPVNGMTEVPTGETITVYFNESVLPGNNFGQISLKASGVPVTVSCSINAGILSIVPSGLEDNKDYTVEIPEGAVTNLNGIGMSMRYIFSFSTPDTTAPVVKSTDPANGQAGVPLDKSITIQFSEEIRQGPNCSGITINGSPVSGNQSSTYISGDKLYIFVYPQFEYNTGYTVLIPEGAVSDSRGNSLKAPYTFSFTTMSDTVPPEVQYSSPEPGAANVSLSKTVIIDYNENISEGNSFNNITLSSGARSIAVNKTINKNVLTLQPAVKLDANAAYKVTIPAGSVKDYYGNTTANDYTLSFTTGAYDVVELPFAVEDALVSPDSTVVYMLNKLEGKLHSYNYMTGEQHEISLGYVPASMDIGKGSLSTELYVALGSQMPKLYSVKETQPLSIAVIDRGTLTVKDTIKIEKEPFDLAAGRDGHIYITSAVDQWTYIMSYNRTAKTLADKASIRQMSYARLHPSMERIYTVDTDLSPRDHRAYNISQGSFTDPHYPGGYDSPYHGDYPLNTNFRLDPTGKYIFNGSGIVFTAAQDKSLDMRYMTKLDTGFTDIAFDTDMSSFYTLPVGNTILNIYSGKSFTILDRMKLAGAGKRILKQGNKALVLMDYQSSTWYGTGLQVIDLPDLAPRVISSNPANNTQNVPVDQLITAAFSESIFSGSNYQGISLNDNTGSQITADCTINDNILSIKPQQPMKYNTAYSLNIPSNAVKDKAENGLASGFALNFTTQIPLDAVPPAVKSTVPVNGQSNVPIGSSLIVNFSEPISQGVNYNSIVLKDRNGVTVGLTKSISEGTVTLMPEVLNYSTGYTLLIPAAAVQDKAGNSLMGEYSLSFDTEARPDTEAPCITGADPAKDAVNQPINKVISITFNEPVKAANTAASLITLKDSANNSIQVTTSVYGNTLTAAPRALEYGTKYTLSIPAGSIEDYSGNLLAANYFLSFNTEAPPAPPDIVPPAVISTSPSAKAVNVSCNTAITITFNEEIILGSNYGNITIKKGNTAVAFSRQISGNQLILTPASPLAKGSTYTVNIPVKAVKDKTGNESAAACSFSFTTAKK